MLDTIASKLRAIRDNPKQLYIQGCEITGDSHMLLHSFAGAFGTPHFSNNSSPTCGKVIHPVEFFAAGGFHQQPDLHYCNYCILVGTQFGIAARGSFNHIIRDMADARARGMKLIVIDPIGGFAGSKADQWVPIRPGTDMARGLALAHHICSTSGMYDYVRRSAARSFVVGTEAGILYRLRRENPDKEFILPTSRLICPNMKLTALEDVLHSLETLSPRITVPPAVAARAKVALERMLAIPRD